MAAPTLVHLIYIHGFQGDDTTFQAFPKNLQEYLSANIPEHLNIKIQSSLYPTYKSAKPISHATRNFLEWLSTQPPGPVILMGHSMGGLLAAEAATDPSNNPDSRPQRIVGVIAFDTPYLGMHPHVVVSGIASLFPKASDPQSQKPKEKEKTEKAMNNHPQVHIVDKHVTDDWGEFKRHLAVKPPLSLASSASSLRSTDSLASSTYSSSPTPFLAQTLSSFSSSDKPLLRWLGKHADDPFSAGKRWVTERFQFGASMFDPPGLKARYARLVGWGEDHKGLWVNYWTETVPWDQGEVTATGPEEISTKTTEASLDNDDALLVNGIVPVDSSLTQGGKSPEPLPPSPTPSPKDTSPKPKPKKPLKGPKAKPARHFIVLPNGIGQCLGGFERWENVIVAGVEDEVNAHTGLFIPHHNLDYSGLVLKVARRILGWCEELPGIGRK